MCAGCARLLHPYVAECIELITTLSLSLRVLPTSIHKKSEEQRADFVNCERADQGPAPLNYLPAQCISEVKTSLD